MQKPVALVPIPLPPQAQRVNRGARFARKGEKRDRYHLPEELDSPSPVGYRVRLPLSPEEAVQAAALLSLEPPVAFVPGPGPLERELFEEASLGVLSARQSTNTQAQRQVVLGPADAAKLPGALPHATHAVIGLSKPYRTPFTLLLTFVGHKPVSSLFTVPKRAWDKRFHHQDDIPTIGFLQHLHVGIWAEAMERAALLASGGRRRARVRLVEERDPALEAAAGLTPAELDQGWRVCLVAEVGNVAEPSPIEPALCRKLGANLLAFRSERIQPGVNAEDKAPPAYQARQDMDVPPQLVDMAGRAAFNAFHRWTGLDREKCKELLLLERIDVLTAGGKERLREVRRELEEITDKVVQDLPLWADLPTGKALSGNAARGKKAFALAGQRIYVGGLDRREVEGAGVGWIRAVRAFGAAAARGALTAELSGCVGLPEGCDLLAGICLMAGPVNQNDIGKQFYGKADLLAGAYPGKEPTSLLVWTLKAKTVADPVGNEEQLLNAKKKGALVDLRPGPHELVSVVGREGPRPMRRRLDRRNGERAFADQDNFLRDSEGVEIPGNRGSAWPEAWAGEDPFA